MTAHLFVPTMAVFGVGLIGGSLSIALKRSQSVGRVIGVGRSEANLQTALKLNVIDDIEHDPIKAVEAADLVVLATPVNTVAELLTRIHPAVTEKKVVTDVGSVKSAIVTTARACLKERFSRFVPGHPIAGREKSGVRAAKADLFDGHKVVLTPLPDTDRDACALVGGLWQTVGAEIRIMDVAVHDRVLGITSHLPHVLAYAMMDFLARSDDRSACYEMTAGGFYDFTRTASSDPEMWRDIMLMNKAPLLAHLAQFQDQLESIAMLIEQGDGAALEALFAASKQARARVAGERGKSDAAILPDDLA